MPSVLTLISIYSDSKLDVNQARLVEGKDTQNELSRHVCKLTYKVLNDSLLGERQEMLMFLQNLEHHGLRLPPIVSDAAIVQSSWVIVINFTSLYS